jgi:hypothetical protein
MVFESTLSGHHNTFIFNTKPSISVHGNSMCMAHSLDADQNQVHSLGDRLFLGLYFGSHKIPSAVCYLLRAADAGLRSTVTGMWLGLLTPRMLRKLDVWYYTKGFADVYRDTDYNTSGLFEWEETAVRTFFPEGSSILVAAGAGAGREVLALNRKGYRADGFEYNQSLINIGNALLTENGLEPTIYPGPANELPAGSKLYDGIIVGWGTYTLIAGRESRISLLKQIRARCVPGAPLLLSFFHRPGNTPSYKVTTMTANSIRTVLRRPKVEIGDTLQIGYAHRFTEKEIAEEMTGSGFQPVFFKAEPYAHAVGIAV